MSFPLTNSREATGDGAPEIGDIPVSLDMMPPLLRVEYNTPYTWAHRGVLPQHDGMCGRSRWWWRSKITAWHQQRIAEGGRRVMRPVPSPT